MIRAEWEESEDRLRDEKRRRVRLTIGKRKIRLTQKEARELADALFLLTKGGKK